VPARYRASGVVQRAQGSQRQTLDMHQLTVDLRNLGNQ
jgi:hypothetical protein